LLALKSMRRPLSCLVVGFPLKTYRLFFCILAHLKAGSYHDWQKGGKKNEKEYILFDTHAVMVLGLAQYSDAEGIEADLAFMNGKVITVDRDFSIKQAIAVKDGWIVAVGSNKDIERLSARRLSDRPEREPDFAGINDSHCHTAAFASGDPPLRLK